VEQGVQLERIDRAGVEAREALAYMLEQASQLAFVVVADELPGRAASPVALAHG
jgi:hypothetical protein